jgi:signal transduction histidine kinase
VRAAFLASVALAIIAAVVEFGLVRPMEAREDARLGALAGELADLVAKEGTGPFGARSDPGEGWAAVVDGKGVLLATRGRAVPDSVASVRPGAAVTLAGQGEVDSRAAAAPVPGRDQVVVAGLPLLEVRRRQAEYRAILAAACLTGVLLVGAGAWFSASLVLEPLGAMTATGRRISAERIDLRLPVRGTGDELDALAALLNDLLAHLGGALEDERRFSGDAAHELRAPLAMMRLRAEKAARGGEAAAMREALEATVEETDRVARLVEALLRFARGPAGAEGAPPLDAAAAVAALGEEFRPLAEAMGLALAAPAAAGPLPVAVPPEVLETCVSVLLDNAFRYTPRGGRVGIAVAGEGGEVVVRVSDSGPGIAAAEAEKVFERLYRGAAGKAAGPGFGLGLALARRLARQAGGEVALENPGAPGARLALRLPRAG